MKMSKDRIYSFDVFDTCLVRKCGAPENLFDVLSLRVFNGDVEETVRQEFVAARYLAQQSVQSASMTLKDIWNAFSWVHPQLKSKTELCRLEQETEREMLAPVLKMLDKVNECRQKGHRIVFISDMYLSSVFISEVLQGFGFMHDGDGVYVSCECGAEKNDGSLFSYVREKEKASYSRWHHYGDNKQSDYIVPRKLGIHCKLINLGYTPYQQRWRDNDYSLGFKYNSILAGIGRALRYSTEWTTHTDFVLDLIAPFYCSMVYRMMHDAELRGIKRLYFCARDAYMMYLIAEKFVPLFPSLECRFLYVSKKSLYEGDDELKKAYFIQERLATTKDYVAIVDVRSSGKTIHFLNRWLQEKGFFPVRGYFFEMFASKSDKYSTKDYYTEVNTIYTNHQRLLAYGIVYEDFFSLNKLRRTIGYAIKEDGVVPVFDTEEEKETDVIEKASVQQKDYWSEIHEALIISYADWYLRYVSAYSEKIFEQVSIPTLVDFFTCPDKHYLHALEGIEMHKWKSDSIVKVAFIKRMGFLSLLWTKGKDTYWKRGTWCLSLPGGLFKVLYSLIHRN